MLHMESRSRNTLTTIIIITITIITIIIITITIITIITITTTTCYEALSCNPSQSRIKCVSTLNSI